MPRNRWPFRCRNAVDRRVAQHPIGADLVGAQNAVLLGAQPLNRPAALVVKEMRAEFHRNAV